MTTFRFFSRLLLGALFVAAPLARAASLTSSADYSFTYSLGDALANASGRNLDLRPLSVEAFDASLGELTGITVQLQLNTDVPGLILTDSWQSDYPANIQITYLGTGFVLNDLNNGSQFFLYNSNLKDTNASPSTITSIGTGDNYLGAFSKLATFTQNLSLSNYSKMVQDGLLPFDLYLSGSMSINSNISSYLSVSGTATASGTLSVTYTYNPVPEPGRFFLVTAAGLFAIAGWGRRKKNRRGIK